MTEFCTICGHPRGEQIPVHGQHCGCGCHAAAAAFFGIRPATDFQKVSHVEEPMPELKGDNWPLVSCARNFVGQLGIRVVWPGMQLQVDEIAFNIEPERALRLRDQLTAHLRMVGLE